MYLRANANLTHGRRLHTMVDRVEYFVLARRPDTSYNSDWGTDHITRRRAQPPIQSGALHGKGRCSCRIAENTRENAATTFHLDVGAVHPHHQVEEHLPGFNPDVHIVETVFRSLERQPNLHARNLSRENPEEMLDNKQNGARQSFGGPPTERCNEGHVEF